MPAWRPPLPRATVPARPRHGPCACSRRAFMSDLLRTASTEGALEARAGAHVAAGGSRKSGARGGAGGARREALRRTDGETDGWWRACPGRCLEGPWRLCLLFIKHARLAGPWGLRSPDGREPRRATARDGGGINGAGRVCPSDAELLRSRTREVVFSTSTVTFRWATAKIARIRLGSHCVMQTKSVRCSRSSRSSRLDGPTPIYALLVPSA